MTRNEWQKFRVSGIGASDAASIVGLSPYKSNVHLWEEKTGRREPEDISSKPYVKYGTDAEKHIRGLYELDHPEHKVIYKDFDIVSHPEHQFIFATLDGRLYDGARYGVLEVKTCDINRSTDWQKWDGKVPDNYYVQLLHQLLASGFDFAVLTAKLRYTGKDGKASSIIKPPYVFERQDLADDLDYLLTKEIEWWRCVTTNTRPALILPEI